jgi:predicted AAA+ superfamily ATPase
MYPPMRRTFEQTLIKWKEAPARKPLLLQGARQTGKTWILETFGKKEFGDNVIFLDFSKNPEHATLFEASLDPKRILTALSIEFSRDIQPENTLLVFDEVQLCPNALTSLKYFCESLPDAYVCASGSLLGVGLTEQNFPVGKVQREVLHPMSFFEFLDAAGEQILRKALEEAANAISEIPPSVHAKAFALFKEFMICGGLPEPVSVYLKYRETPVAAHQKTRELQRELIQSYLDDIAKHSGSVNAMRIAALFNDIPGQLARENTGAKKFRFKGVLPGRSSYAELSDPLQWLQSAGLIHRIPICRKLRTPLAPYAEKNSFMLYLFDIGILGAMLHLAPAVIYKYDFGQFKGFLAENAVLVEMISAGINPVYTWRGVTSEIEFLVEDQDQFIPVEVKAGINTKAKSLRVFRETYHPERELLFSGKGTNQQDHALIHAPVYLAGNETFFKREQSVSTDTT